MLDGWSTVLKCMCKSNHGYHIDSVIMLKYCRYSIKHQSINQLDSTSLQHLFVMLLKKHTSSWNNCHWAQSCIFHSKDFFFLEKQIWSTNKVLACLGSNISKVINYFMQVFHPFRNDRCSSGNMCIVPLHSLYLLCNTN